MLYYIVINLLNYMIHIESFYVSLVAIFLAILFRLRLIKVDPKGLFTLKFKDSYAAEV